MQPEKERCGEALQILMLCRVCTGLRLSLGSLVKLLLDQHLGTQCFRRGSHQPDKIGVLKLFVQNHTVLYWIPAFLLGVWNFSTCCVSAMSRYGRQLWSHMVSQLLLKEWSTIHDSTERTVKISNWRFSQTDTQIRHNLYQEYKVIPNWKANLKLWKLWTQKTQSNFEKTTKLEDLYFPNFKTVQSQPQCGWYSHKRSMESSW